MAQRTLAMTRRNMLDLILYRSAHSSPTVSSRWGAEVQLCVTQPTGQARGLHAPSPAGVLASARPVPGPQGEDRSEEHTSELQSHSDLVCRLLLEKKTHQ